MGHYETNYGTTQVDFLGQEKLKLGHNKTNYRTKQDDILGQEKLIFIISRCIFGLNEVSLGDRRSQF